MKTDRVSEGDEDNLGKKYQFYLKKEGSLDTKLSFYLQDFSEFAEYRVS